MERNFRVSLIVFQAAVVITIALAGFVGAGALSDHSAAPTQDGRKRSSEKMLHYDNPARGYCVDYTPRWKRSQADLNPDFVRFVPDERICADCEILFGAVPNQPKNPDAPPAEWVYPTVEEVVTAELKRLPSDAAGEVQLLARKSINIQDRQAVLIRLSYVEKSGRRVEIEDVRFVNGNVLVLFAHLKASADRFQNVEPLFLDVVEHHWSADCRNRGAKGLGS